ncbi:left-right determination factor 2 isoform X2 [Cricetulus griseus]|uniref:Left-right determination factor 2 isoform X2 n=1 Tax=Cricetulus griseus TaxID=10029 RepID=A0A9J7K9R1_CRIGR|nr:left-right determination factor 2 isoform X2 [Cricetulus griseus]XP_035314873.1 left-right determination factor 2 isoform X2 [Cricetulus griseus]
MQSLWLCWVLWALALAGCGAAVTEEQILVKLLQQLQLSRAPVLDNVDVETMAIPAHVRAQYVSLLHRSHGDRSRGKRFSQNFREVAGRFLVSETSKHLHERLSPHSARARVTIEWLRVREDGSNRTALIDSRLVSIHESGWKAFDVTEAVNFWQQLSRPRQPLLLQVSVQREHLGPGTWSAHKLVRFAAQGIPGREGRGEPQLELHTLDLKDYGAQGNCNPETPVTEGTRCCRQEMYLDLQGMKWAENWILEPPGFLVYECVGSCLQLPESLTIKWPFLGPRQCIASEMTSLPVIVSMKEGGRTRPQVVSLPNMRVQRCSCVSDGALVPRGIDL